MYKNIVIVGGGTAGWLAALYVNKIYPQHNITVIESSSIGIAGAGEGTTPEFIQLLDVLGIEFKELVKNTQSTIKNGIKFSNWNGDGEYYHHPFFDPLCLTPVKNHFVAPDFDYRFIYSDLKNKSINDLFVNSCLSENNLVPFSKTDESNNFSSFEQNAYWAAHIDGNQISQYFKKVGLDRGIKLIDGVVKDFDLDENGNIFSIKLDDDSVTRCDFIFDCSGFQRIIIGKKLNSRWISKSQTLPCNSAIPFFLDVDYQLPPYTESISMKNGWMWKIPLQQRYGCGYVFDDRYTTADIAKKEVEEMLGLEINVPKTFKFDAGYYEDIWIKNCVAIGLSSSFIEPLEATSIIKSITDLKYLLSNQVDIFENNEYIRSVFNKRHRIEMEDTIDFIYLHYLCNRNDSEFWKSFRDRTKIPESILNILEIIKSRPITPQDIIDNESVYGDLSYWCVIFGNKLVPITSVKKYEKEIDYSYIQYMKNETLNIKNKSMTHNYFLEILNNE